MSTPEHEPQHESDPFISNLKRYMYDVYALEVDGEGEVANNRIRLAIAFHDLLKTLGVSDELADRKTRTLIPSDFTDTLEFTELILQYKLAPLRLIGQNQLDPPLAVESITPKRIETIFNFALADEEERHGECPTNEHMQILACSHNLTCPKKLGYIVGSDLLEILLVQRYSVEGSDSLFQNPAFANLVRLQQSLITAKVMTSDDIMRIADATDAFIDEYLSDLKPSPRRTTDETNDS